jgi:hypothetical protein
VCEATHLCIRVCRSWLVRGAVRELWRTKEHRVRALADGWSRDLRLRKVDGLNFSQSKIPSEKLAPFKKSVFLQFTDPRGLPPPPLAVISPS